MPISAAQLDAMLKATGSPVVFTGVPATYGKLRREELLGTDGQGIDVAVDRTTLLVRDGTQPPGLAEDDAVTVAGVAHVVLDIGVVRPDGLRKLTLVKS